MNKPIKISILIILSILNLYFGILSWVYFIDYTESGPGSDLFNNAIYYANSVLWFITFAVQMIIGGPVLLGSMTNSNPFINK